jgi:hypothetical protein
MPQLSGWLCLVIDVALVALLALAILYGIVRWRSRPRDPATEKVRDEATRRSYRE